MSNLVFIILVKNAVFSSFFAFFQKFGTPKVTIFCICQCEKWTNKNKKTVETSKTKVLNCARCYKVQKSYGKTAKKYVDISQKSVIIIV